MNSIYIIIFTATMLRFNYEFCIVRFVQVIEYKYHYYILNFVKSCFFPLLTLGIVVILS